ncbi:50S ribosomal protein L24 [bacterium]|nr:50S ribosomal protein L24 [bacterium]|tara:strand:- start:1376 stop:1675 length:300 start_codon:yes stop_codon:yes gene_type:complete
MKIKKGDSVIVIAGKDKGKTGTVSQTLPKSDQVLVEGVNLATKHQKNRRLRSQGQVIEKEMPIHVSNVALNEDGKPVRVRYESQDGQKVRVSAKTGKKI